MNKMQLEQLWIYPVKSLAGISLPRIEVVKNGFFLDRQWMLVDAQSGSFLTQRQFPGLALLKLELDQQIVRIEATGQGSIQFEYGQNDGRKKTVKVWNDELQAETVSQVIDDWFSDYLKQSVQLASMPVNTRRQVDRQYANDDETTGFADGFPFLLIGTASLEDLNQRLPQDQQMNMQRFRPNLVIRTEQPFIEDQWHRVRIGQQTFRLVKPCSRCSITTVNPQTGETSPEPLKTLSSYRRQGQQVMFGQNVLHDSRGFLHIGDKLEVLRRL